MPFHLAESLVLTFFQWLLVVFAFGIAAIFEGLKAFRRSRKVEDTPRTPIGTAPQGTIAVQGFAWPTNRLTSLDGRAVSYWKITLEELKRNDDPYWEELRSFASNHDILVTDDSGSCRVSPDKAVFQLKLKSTKYTEVSPENLHRLKAQAPEVFRHFISLRSTRRLRLVEEKLVAGTPLYVRGAFSSTSRHREVAAVGGYQEFRSELGALKLQSQQALRFDQDQDGALSEEEAQEGFVAIAKESLDPGKLEAVSISGFFQASEQQELLIADVHKSHLLARYREMTVFLWPGVFAFSFGVFVLILMAWLLPYLQLFNR